MYKQLFFVFSTGEYDEASDVLNNLGYIIEPLMYSEEVSCGVSSFSAGQKFKLLTIHQVLTSPFLAFFIAAAIDPFSTIEKYEWLVYSKVVDGGFCRFCA